MSIDCIHIPGEMYMHEEVVPKGAIADNDTLNPV